MKQPYKTPRGLVYSHPSKWLVCQTEWPVSEQETWSVYPPGRPYWDESIYRSRPFIRRFGTPTEAFAYLYVNLRHCAAQHRSYLERQAQREAANS